MPKPVVQDPSQIRRWRNFLLNPRLQLKFAGYLIALSLVPAALLVVFLFLNAQSLQREAGIAVEARSRAAEASRELSNATLSNELLSRMGDPVFVAQLRDKSRAIDERFEAERAAVIAQRAELLRSQRLTWLVLGVCMVGFILFITLATIVATHRIAGPLLRIRRMAEEVSSGRIRAPVYGLREKDELKDVFDTTRNMVSALRKMHEDDILVLSHALERAQQQGVSGAWLEDLRALESRLRARLE